MRNHFDEQADFSRNVKVWLEEYEAPSSYSSSQIGTAWRLHNLRTRFWTPVVEKVNLDPKKFTPYALRNTFASLHIANGVDEFVLCKRMGHDIPVYTKKVYVYLFEDQQDEAAEVMGRYLLTT